jgi:hypothetical protein
MADESVEHRDTSSGSTERPPRDDEINKAGNSSNRRRIIITSLLTPPAVMTLRARKAHAQSAGSTVGSSDLQAQPKNQGNNYQGNKPKGHH